MIRVRPDAPSTQPEVLSVSVQQAEPPEPEPNTLFDRAAGLFRAWRGGDGQALDQLIRLVTPTLWHTVRAYQLDQGTAEDIIQDTWFALLRTGDQVADPQSIVGWLTTTARRQAWKVAQRQRRMAPVEDEVIDALAAAVPATEEIVVRDQRDTALWAAVATLSQRCQRLLRVIAFADRPNYRHVGVELGMPIGSIGPTRGRCLETLRKLLAAGGDWRS